ncbi:glycosyltransferase family 4 protein [Thiocapsa rosea]|uniref:Glycosyltransferase involved in cell wall biosynthesis n=1 Tax=Thiocapsa rosea TaxID=69360 RepID=A0A495VB38_9GAMM|nr:glycosyltransferase family 4 protein [Thiocapsa rosea]RKT45577.1 glycosyltransferase involved in cell wall biosynthesis [Thiocapsa rosea]
MEVLRLRMPEARVAYVPDYVCNVVGEACRKAGFETVEYPTNMQCMPEWRSLELMIGRNRDAVLVLCSQFGSVPVMTPEAETLVRANPGIFVVADECQNLVPDSPVRPERNRAVLFSFNDKTCPGVMGGGVAVSRESPLDAPVVAIASMSRRLLCTVALYRLWFMGIGRILKQSARLAIGAGQSHRLPTSYEFSVCKSPHYDLRPEPIYKLSAARALMSVNGLERYRRLRVENAKSLRQGLNGLQVGLDLDGVVAGPAFLPIMAGVDELPVSFPAAVKASYGRSPIHATKADHWYSLKINMPHLSYAIKPPVVVQLTTRHAITDNRILHLMARTADCGGFESLVMGPAYEHGVFEGIELRATPRIAAGAKLSSMARSLEVLIGAYRSGYPLFHIHDPDLIPAGLVLRLLGRRVIYDVHDDYEASLKDRLRTRAWLARWFPATWWWFERYAATAFNGVVVADRHLAGKFAVCAPVILGNYPRLDFTPPAQAEEEETFNLIYVGGVTRERGLGVALEAIRRLPYPELRLHVIGAGRDSALMDALRAEPRVVLHGRVPWTELHRYYSRAHVGLALYQPLQGFLYYPGENAVKIVEYMSAGIPVLCSNFPGLKTFVEDAGCGLVVQPDDAEAIAEKIQALVDNPGLRRQLGATGRRLFEIEYNWEKHQGRLIQLYERVLAK